MAAGGEFEVKNSLQEANTLLADKEYQVDEVISGTFSTGSLYGPWRTVQALAAERDLGFTLLTSLGHGISLQQAEELNKQGIGVLDKIDFWPGFNQFLDQRLPVGGQKEIK